MWRMYSLVLHWGEEIYVFSTIPFAFLHSPTTLTLNLWERNMLRHNVENKVNLIKQDTRRKKKKTAIVI